MTPKTSCRFLALVAGAAVLAASAHAGPVKERGNIVSVDWNKMQVELKDPKGRIRTWTVTRDATVKFTDKKAQFPNPKLQDLRPPMYVHFVYESTTDVIQDFEVVEVGFNPAQGGPGVREKGVITNLNASIGHLEVNLGAGRQTFEVDPKDQLRGFKIGDKVSILIERREGNREVVTKIDKQ